MPAPALVGDALHGLDRHPHAREVRHPALEHGGERPRALAPRREVEQEGEELVAQEVERRVLRVQHVHLHRGHRRLLLLDEAPEVAEAAGLRVGLDRGGVGGEHLPCLDAHALRPEEELPGAGEPGIGRCPRAAPGRSPGPAHRRRAARCRRARGGTARRSRPRPTPPRGAGRGSAGTPPSSRGRPRPRRRRGRPRRRRAAGLSRSLACRWRSPGPGLGRRRELRRGRGSAAGSRRRERASRRARARAANSRSRPRSPAPRGLALHAGAAGSKAGVSPAVGRPVVTRCRCRSRPLRAAGSR